MAVQGEFGDNNFLTGFLVNTLNPNSVYEHFTYIAGVAAVVPWLIVVFGAVRVAQESADAMSGKAALAEAMGDASKTLLMFLAYSGGGLLVFALLFALSTLFEGFGSSRLIHQEMVDLRAVLMADPEAQKDWFQRVLEGVADVTNIFSAGLVWAIYQFLSVAYISLSRLIDVMFAIGIALTYGWGFVAITTRVMKNEFNLMPGFTKTVLTFGIWVILEPLLLFFVWLMSLGAVEYLTTYYSGSDLGTTAMTLWYLFSCVMMSLVVLIKIIAPFLALYLARNDSMVGALGAGPAVLGGIVANQVVRMLADNTVMNEMKGVMPTGEGTRGRDTMAQGVSNALHAPMGQLFGGGGSNDLSSATPGDPGSGGPRGDSGISSNEISEAGWSSSSSESQIDSSSGQPNTDEFDQTASAGSGGPSGGSESGTAGSPRESGGQSSESNDLTSSGGSTSDDPDNGNRGER